MTAPADRPEFSRTIDLRQITAAPVTLLADPAECAALAERFGLVALDRLEAVVTLVAEGDVVRASGRLQAAWTQPCAVSGDDLAQSADEALALRFVPEQDLPTTEAEIELTAEDCDDIPYRGSHFDLGEAVAQSLGLAIDPFACGPNAEAARQSAGILSEGAAGAFGALAGLKLGKD
ncbi:YceD family protein [Novosphingobium aerophilum]|uniref:DUF177 domain-containing protein n=1 Tax=Novosphingobium aerophilum TaxID=2839843 RepID=A0A7X1F9S0_9SPHN|nr:DUF177 domain-containing protein [Novosphingobium aerophilum]MBC2653035.1 DUF177 domain-containing protein [Novosphingobium aerophilum]